MTIQTVNYSVVNKKLSSSRKICKKHIYYIYLRERSQCEKPRRYMTNYMTIWKRGNYWTVKR